MANDFMGVVSGGAIPIAYKPSGWQTTAGVLLIMTQVLSLLYPIIPIFCSRSGNSFEMISSLYGILSWSTLGCYIVAYILLCTQPQNKAARIGAIIAIVSEVITEVADYGYNIFGTTVISICVAIAYIAFVYGMMLIMRNCKISQAYTNWIYLLIAFSAISIFNIFFWRAFPFLEIKEHISNQLSIGLLFYLSGVFLMIANWKLARCEAFNGEKNETEKVNFVPTGKFYAAIAVPVVMALVFLLILFTIYPNPLNN
ncbi:MAG: hypothetical protein ACI4BC_08555 [Muribaculaceae bacterium]